MKLKLLEKLVRTKIRLEDAIKELHHDSRCMIELDPTSYAPCSCGVSKTRSILQTVLDELNEERD
jgi:hypothetical protein